MQLKSQIGHIEYLNSATLSVLSQNTINHLVKLNTYYTFCHPDWRVLPDMNISIHQVASGPHEVTHEILPSHVDIWYKLTT